MDLTINPQVDLSDTAPLRVGGVEFRVARLMFRQTSRIEPKLPDILALLNRRATALAGAKQGPDGNPVFDSEAAADAFLRTMALSEAESDFMLGVVLTGLSRVYPRLTFDDLADLPLRTSDLFDAATVIVSAARLVERKAHDTGEANAASR